METGTAEFARKPKAGLLRALPAAGQKGRGTQAPGEGFALTIAARECAKLTFEHEHDRHDVALGVGLVAAKRASLIGRGPQLDQRGVHHVIAVLLLGFGSDIVGVCSVERHTLDLDVQLLVRLLLVQSGHQSIAFYVARDAAGSLVLHDRHADPNDAILLGQCGE